MTTTNRVQRVIETGMRMVDRSGFQMAEWRASDLARGYPAGSERRQFWFEVAQAIADTRADLEGR